MHPNLATSLRVCAASLAMVSIAIAASTPPKLVQPVSPVHPEELLAKGVDGRAKINFSIDERGNTSDITVVEATDPAFGEAAVEAVEKWKFQPATRDGAPVAMKATQEFKFDVPPEKKLEIIAGRPVFVALEGEVIDARELKEQPKAAVPLTPVYPKNLIGSGKEGLVRLKFVINTDGLPVNPEIVASDGDPMFQSMAVISLLRARWNPIEREGKHVNVSMTVPVQFREKEPARGEKDAGGKE